MWFSIVSELFIQGCDRLLKKTSELRGQKGKACGYKACLQTFIFGLKNPTLQLGVIHLVFIHYKFIQTRMQCINLTLGAEHGISNGQITRKGT